MIYTVHQDGRLVHFNMAHVTAITNHINHDKTIGATVHVTGRNEGFILHLHAPAFEQLLDAWRQTLGDQGLADEIE